MLKTLIPVYVSLMVAVSYTALARAEVPDFVHSSVPEASQVGQARYTHLFWDVYDARLFAPNGQWQPEDAFALSLTYLRDFDGADIAKSSINEMREQGLTDKVLIDRWQQILLDIFPDVKEQDTITGIKTAQDTTRFYLDNQLLGEVEEKAFSKRFFNIWLGPDTTHPEFRVKLLKLED